MDDVQLQHAAEALAATGVTAEQVRQMLRDSREPATPVTTPSLEAVSPPAAKDADDPLDRAEAALDAEQRRTMLVSGAKAILRQQHGHDPADDWTDDELIHLAGLGPDPHTTPAREAERERLERDAVLLADPAALARHRHEQEVAELRLTWWQKSKSERTEQLERLGIHPDHWTPPTNFNGLS